MQHHLRLREFKMNELQNKMAEQTRIKELRDDPLAAAHSTKYQSHITRLERYLDNTGKLQGRLQVAEQYLQSGNELLHRVRELAIQGANGTYTADQRRMMATEVNSYLSELVEIANARSGDGTAMFGGDALAANPFRTLSGSVPGSNGLVLTDVMYIGGPARSQAEVSEGSLIETTFAGGDIFWAEQHAIMTDVNAATYSVDDAATLLIDGVNIDLKAGDNVYSIIAKINESDAAVRASLDPVQNSLVLRSTYPHQLRIEDGAGSTVLQDLGVVTGRDEPPHNLAPEARVSGGSVFDMIMYVRDQLWNGDVIDVSGAGLRGLDQAQHNLLASLADLGTRSERLQIIESRISYEIPEMRRRNSEEVDLDLSEAILDLKMLEYAHQAALQTAGRVLRQTLLDFLR